LKKYSLLLSCFLATALSAGSDSDNIENLVKDLADIKDQASQTKQNIDYQPFIMTVWTSQKLSRFGCLTLKDALMLFPGVDVVSDNLYNQTPIFRGSNPFAYGQTKLFVDGVLVNDRTFDGFNAYLMIPVEMIKRVEVVRGPGGFEVDEGGYAGSIRVVTYAEDTDKTGGKIYAGYGKYDSKSFGAYYNGKISDWNTHAELFKYSNSMKFPLNGKDGLENDSKYPSNRLLSASGSAPLNLDTYSASFSASNDSFLISSRITKYQTGGAFGVFYSLPDEGGKITSPSWYIDLKYKKNYTNDARIELNSGYINDGWSYIGRILPAGYKFPVSAMTITTLNYGYWADTQITQRAYYAGGLLDYSGVASHRIKIGAKYINEKNLEVKSVNTDNLGLSAAMVDYGDAPFFDPSAKRTTLKLFVNDTWELSDKLALTLGVSSDKANDFDRQNNYRVSAVYQPNSDDIFKFMASSAYRAPAWQEMYTMNNLARMGNKNLLPETVKAYELQYIKKLSLEDTISANIFHIDNKNQIAKILNPLDGRGYYQNAGNPKINGGEIELRKNLTERDFVFVNYSYAKGVYDGNLMPGSATNMAKSGYIREWGRGFSSGVSLFYVDSKSRIVGDTRANTAAYTSADLTLNYDASHKIWGAQVGVKNITDALILSPSEKGTYSGDYPSGGRLIFAKLFGRF
jgi:outer membrane receptor protein involved in Fe transport